MKSDDCHRPAVSTDVGGEAAAQPSPAALQPHPAPGEPDTPSLTPPDPSFVNFLDRLWPAIAPADSRPGEAGFRGQLTALGRFRLLRELGRGGAGVIYLAEDPHLGRPVALKVPRAPLLLDPVQRERFLREARAAALLDHPHVVAVHEAGEAGGVLYIAYAYCPGPTLAEWLRERGWAPFRDTARLVADLADAVFAAHQRGVLHRDLKPSNVLLQRSEDALRGTSNPGQTTDVRGQRSADPATSPNSDFSPLPSFTPKVSDFGLAKLLDEVGSETAAGLILGTPAYMTPEQARGRGGDASVAVDVYGLGAILYELLTGRPPFRGATDADTLRQVVADDPIPPRRERGDVPPDLEAVCLKCLEKEPDRRYGSAADIAADLRRFLNGHSTRARPLGQLGRAIRWARRRPDLAALSALTMATVLAAVIGGEWFTARLAATRADHAAAAREAATHEFYALLERVRQRRSDPRAGWTVQNLTDLRRAAQLSPAGEHLVDLRSEAAAAMAGIELRRVACLSGDFEVYCLKFSPDGKSLALGGWGTADDVCRVRLVHPTDGRVLRELTFAADRNAMTRTGKVDGCRDLAFSPDGRWLVVSSRFGGLHRWNLNERRACATSWPQGAEESSFLAFGTSRPILFSKVRERFGIWDAEAGWSEVSPWTAPERLPAIDPITGRVAYLSGGGLHLVDGRSFQPCRAPLPIDNYGTLIFDPRGRTVAVRNGRSLHLRDAETGYGFKKLALPGSDWADTDVFEAVEFSADGGLLATGSEWSRHVRLWDVVGGQLGADVVAGDRGSMRLAFFPDGQQLVVATEGRADVYQICGLSVRSSIAVHPFPVWAADLAADGRSIVCATIKDAEKWSHGGELFHWHAGSSRLPPSSQAQIVSPRREPLVAITPDGSGVAFPTADHIDVRTTAGQVQYVADGSPSDLRFAPDGRLWVVLDNEVLVYAPSGWHQTYRWVSDSHTSPAGNAYRKVAPGRNWVLVGRRDGRVFLLDANAQRVGDWPVGETPVARDSRATAWEPITALHLNERASLAVAGTEKGRVRFFRIPSGEVLAHLPEAHRDAVDAAAISPDSRLVVTGGRDRAIRLWRPDGTPILTLRATAPVTMLTFTSDGKELLTLGAGERGLRRWHLDRLDVELRALGLGALEP